MESRRPSAAAALLPLLLAASLACARAAPPPKPPCYSPLNPDFETLCYTTVAQEGAFSLRDYAQGVDAAVVDSFGLTLSEAAQFVLTYFTGKNGAGAQVARTVPVFFRPIVDADGFIAINGSMPLPTSVYPNPALAPSPQSPNNGPLESFPTARFAAITFETVDYPAVLDYAFKCGELGEEMDRRGLKPVVAGRFNQTWATYSLVAAATKVSECLIEVQV